MFPFIRLDLVQFTAYKPRPSSDTAQNVQASIQIDLSAPRGVKAERSRSLDPLDTNESPYDLPPDLKEKLAWTYQQLIETNRYADGGHETLHGAICRTRMRALCARGKRSYRPSLPRGVS